MSISTRLMVTSGLIVALLPTVSAQQEGNTPPEIEIIRWVVTHAGGINVVFDRDASIGLLSDISRYLHEEQDDVAVTIEVFDADWEGGGTETNTQDEEIYLRFIAEGVRWGFEIGKPYLREITPPEPPPLVIREGNGVFFGATEDEGFRPTGDPPAVLYTFYFEVPEFLGKNQLRLRGVIEFDVAWRLFFAASNEEEPENDFGVGTTSVTLFALENPSLGPPNPQAFADAGADRTVPIGAEVLLDGSRTFDTFNIGFDPDDDTNIFEKDKLSFTWEWISGPVRVDPVPDEPNNPRNPRATVTFNVTGVYVYRLLVDDNVNALPSTDSVEITVVESLPDRNPPRAIIVGPANAVPRGALITLDGSESYDPDGDPLSFRWQQTNEVGGPLALEELQAAFQPLSGIDEAVSTWQAIATGTFYFRLLVDDGDFRSSVTFSVEVIETETGGRTDETTSAPPPANDGASQQQQQNVPATGLCGAGMLPLAAVPLAVCVMRRRLR